MSEPADSRRNPRPHWHGQTCETCSCRVRELCCAEPPSRVMVGGELAYRQVRFIEETDPDTGRPIRFRYTIACALYQDATWRNPQPGVGYQTKEGGAA